MKLTYWKFQELLSARFRRLRMDRFFQYFRPKSETRVLDVGGAAYTWTRELKDESGFPVTLLNILDYGLPKDKRFIAVQGDATRLPFADGSFDIAFSNSVIEHVGNWKNQEAFAGEVRRVAKQLWIQTPARSFPIEAHLLAPYIQYLPKAIQRRIVRFTPRGLLQPEVARQIVEEVRLVTYSEMKRLFPDCVIIKERVMGLTKSYIAVRRT